MATSNPTQIYTSLTDAAIKPMPRNRVQHQKGLSDDVFEQLYPDEEACRKGACRRLFPTGM
jgi:hypothetical protein